MDTASIDALIDRLNLVTESTPSNVGVAMSHDLFMECARRGLIEMKEFSALGTGFLPNILPTYKGKNFSFVHPDFPDWEFQVGRPSAG